MNYDLDVVWYCDGCDAELNRQDGFTTETGTRVCAKCGYLRFIIQPFYQSILNNAVSGFLNR